MSTSEGDLTEAVSALPSAVNPLALSLNENPFPPLPGVRSALTESVEVANRYPEFLPERLRALIAGHVGVREDQVVIGAGATGVIMQVLNAVTSPGDRMVMTSPTFDGYPIFAQMARLVSVTVALDEHGHHDLDAMAEAAGQARVVVVCRPHNPTGTIEPAADIELFLQRVPSDTVVLLDEAYVEFLAPSTGSTRSRWSSGSPMWWCCAPFRRPTGWPDCGSDTASAHPIWPGACGRCSCRSVSASPVWSRSRRPMTRKASCSNGSG